MARPPADWTVTLDEDKELEDQCAVLSWLFKNILLHFSSSLRAFVRDRPPPPPPLAAAGLICGRKPAEEWRAAWVVRGPGVVW